MNPELPPKITKPPVPKIEKLDDYFGALNESRISKNMEEATRHDVELKRPMERSEGDLRIEAGDFEIDVKNGVIRVREPRKKKGTEKFHLQRTPLEKTIAKAWDEEKAHAAANYLNRVLSGVAKTEKTDKIVSAFPCRIAFNVIEIENTPEGPAAVFSMKGNDVSVSPEKRGVHDGALKIIRSNLVRGPEPWTRRKAENTYRGAVRKLEHTVEKIEKKMPPGERKVYGETVGLNAGPWKIEFISKDGTVSSLDYRAAVGFAPEDATFEIFFLQQRNVFVEPDRLEELAAEEKFAGGESSGRLSFLVPIKNLLDAQEGDPMRAVNASFGGKVIKDLSELPEKTKKEYEGLVEFDEKGVMIKSLKMVPSLRMFKESESRIVGYDSTDRVTKERQERGQKETSENLMAEAARLLGAPENKTDYYVDFPTGQELKDFLQDKPEELVNWCLKKEEEGFGSGEKRQLIVRPDFVKDDIFYEVKSGGGKTDQKFRMIMHHYRKGYPKEIHYLYKEGKSSWSKKYPFIYFRNIKKEVNPEKS